MDTKELIKSIVEKKIEAEKQRDWASGNIGAVNQWNGYAIGLGWVIRQIERMNELERPKVKASPEEVENALKNLETAVQNLERVVLKK